MVKSASSVWVSRRKPAADGTFGIATATLVTPLPSRIVKKLSRIVVGSIRMLPLTVNPGIGIGWTSGLWPLRMKKL